jgi:SAM-dependent methyltransferase
MTRQHDACGGYDTYRFVAEFYDHVAPYRDRADVDFFVGMAVRTGGPVLEIGCGTGRVLIPTARRGFEIVGLDLSRRMLDICREKLRDEPDDVSSRVELVHGDMRDFDLGRSFALVTAPFRPFQHLVTVDDQIRCLHAVRRHIADGGLLVLDIFDPHLPMLIQDSGEEFGDEPETVLPDGRRVVRKHRIVKRDTVSQVSDCEIIYYVTHADGRTERLVHGFQMRHIFRFEAEHLLARCGFETESLYGGYDGSPVGSKTPGELIFVARKP